MDIKIQTDQNDKGTRFAELALELFGAQAASKFVSDIWAAASPEVKAALADSVVAAVQKDIADYLKDGTRQGYYASASGIAQRLYVEVVNAELATRLPAIRESIRIEVEKSLGTLADSCTTEITAALRKHFLDRLRSY